MGELKYGRERSFSLRVSAIRVASLDGAGDPTLKICQSLNTRGHPEKRFIQPFQSERINPQAKSNYESEKTRCDVIRFGIKGNWFHFWWIWCKNGHHQTLHWIFIRS